MKKFLCVFLVLCLALLSGCTENTPENDGGKKTVAASFYPVYIFALNLVDGIEGIEVKCMAEQNIGCLHDYTLTSKDVKLLNDAAVLVINGAGMESFVEDVFQSVENLRIIDSSENVEIICSEEHHHEEKSSRDHHHHEGNSHIWLSVDNAIIQVENIKNGLQECFPEYSEKIQENYENYIARLNVLAEERNGFSEKIKGESVISFHAAYEYLAEETGLNIVDTVESDEGGEPSAKELAHLSEDIKELNIKALFLEPYYEGSAAEILGRETSVNTVTLNPVTSGETNLTAYEDIMRENYKTILTAVK